METKKLTAKDVIKQGLLHDTWQDAVEAIREAKEKMIKEHKLQPSLVQWLPQLMIMNKKDEVLDHYRGFYWCAKGLPKFKELVEAVDDNLFEPNEDGVYTALITEGFSISWNVVLRTWDTVADKMNGEDSEPWDLDIDVPLIKFEGVK